MPRRIDSLHDEWAKRVKKRDGGRCQICGKKSKWNHAHHLDGYDWFVAGRYVLANGITLCSGMGKNGYKKGCHNQFHDMFGRGGNSREQFEQFKRIMKK
jgi:5-methylcytosine-specific restriction endonuclease McrA